MRIGLVLEQALAPIPGGAGRYAVELAAALARTAADGEVVEGWTAWHRDVSPARIDKVRGPRRFALPRRALVASWERGLGPAPRRVDLVHALTLLFPPRRDRPLVVSIHDTVPWTHPELLTPRGARWHRAMARRAAHCADAVTVLTAAVADELAELLPELSRDRVHVLGAGVSDAIAREPSAAQTRRVVVDLPQSFLLSVATLEPRKGLDVLLDALARLGPAAPHLVVVGQPGWGGVDPIALAERIGLPAGLVRVLGRVSDADLAVLLRRASALVVPSRAEGFGLPVIEAMAVGTPVVCSDVPALVEVAGGAALVVARGDADALAAGLLAVRDRARCEELARVGRVRAAAFRWDVVAARARLVYAELAGPPLPG